MRYHFFAAVDQDSPNELSGVVKEFRLTPRVFFLRSGYTDNHCDNCRKETAFAVVGGQQENRVCGAVFNASYINAVAGAAVLNRLAAHTFRDVVDARYIAVFKIHREDSEWAD
jgi:hypothetical protein